jgi:hypothetical protein
MLPDVCDGRKREVNATTIPKIYFFCALQARIGSCRTFPPVGLPSNVPLWQLDFFVVNYVAINMVN